MAGEIHAQDGVVVIGAGELGRRVGNQHLDQFLYIHTAGADDFDANALRDIAWLHCS